MWSSWFLPKHGFISWMGCMNGLLTNESINRYNSGIDTSRSLCGHSSEDFEHFFFRCGYTRNLLDTVMCRDELSTISYSLQG